MGLQSAKLKVFQVQRRICKFQREEKHYRNQSSMTNALSLRRTVSYSERADA
jgi:hypothetical protein